MYAEVNIDEVYHKCGSDNTLTATVGGEGELFWAEVGKDAEPFRFCPFCGRDLPKILPNKGLVLYEEEE